VSASVSSVGSAFPHFAELDINQEILGFNKLPTCPSYFLLGGGGGGVQVIAYTFQFYNSHKAIPLCRLNQKVSLYLNQKYQPLWAGNF